MKKHSLTYTQVLAVGIAIVLAAFVCIYFWLLTHPAQENLGQHLYPNPENSYGWSYRINGAARWPEFDELGYSPSFPVEGETFIVDARRVMTEKRNAAFLLFDNSLCYLQVYLDDSLLYTDFPEQENHFGTLITWNTAIEKEKTQNRASNTAYVLLPSNYEGKTLTVISYGLSWEGMGHCSYPQLYESHLFPGSYVPAAVLPVALASTAAVIGLLLLLLFLLWPNPTQWSILLLVLFALLSMVAFSGESFPLMIATPGGGTPEIIYFVKANYIAVLFFYFATQMKKPLGILLAIAAALHIVWQLVMLASPGPMITALQSGTLPLLFLLTLVFMILEYRQQALFRFILMAMAPMTVGFLLLAVFSPAMEPNAPCMMLSSAVKSGNWMPLSMWFSALLSLLSALFLYVRFIQTQVQARVMLRAYQLQAAYRQENTNNLVALLDEAKRARHEYRHHLDVLRGLVSKEEDKRAADYLGELLQQEHATKQMQFSEHVVVNVLLSTLYSKARQLGVAVKSSVAVPGQLGISDADLSVIMSNLIENAFEAVLKLPKDEQRFIWLKIGVVDENVLYLSCENSYAGPPLTQKARLPRSTKADHAYHGYGLPVIRQIAQRYNGFLVLDADGTTFHSQVRLHLLDV